MLCGLSKQEDTVGLRTGGQLQTFALVATIYIAVVCNTHWRCQQAPHYPAASLLLLLGGACCIYAGCKHMLDASHTGGLTSTLFPAAALPLPLAVVPAISTLILARVVWSVWRLYRIGDATPSIWLQLLTLTPGLQLPAAAKSSAA
jgi:hypothetical protein